MIRYGEVCANKVPASGWRDKERECADYKHVQNKKHGHFTEFGGSVSVLHRLLTYETLFVLHIITATSNG
jgi:hypothetical protein